MRELRPLILPERMSGASVPAKRNSNPNPPRNSSQDGNLNLGATAPQYAGISSWESLPSMSSECSTPLTPTFSLRGHSRIPSATSSLSSTSPSTEQLEGAVVRAPKLTQLREDPWEGEDEHDRNEVQDDSKNASRSSVIHTQPHEFDFADGFFNEDFDSISPYCSKKDRSSNTQLELVVNRLGTRFSRRRRNTARNSQGPFTLSAAPSTRSSSLTSSVKSGFEQGDFFPNLDPQSIEPHPDPSDGEQRRTKVPKEIIIPDRSIVEPIDRELLASTPLLPPLLNTNDQVNDDVPSPLQSPTVADPNSPMSMVLGPSVELLPLPAVSADVTCTSSPALSTRPSLTSIKQTSSQPSSFLISHPRDAWSTRLGHANFTIDPEPYVPDDLTPPTYRQFLRDWSIARGNYTRHQVRTADHFGPTSKVFKLTEKKWAELDAEWRQNWRTVRKGVAKNSLASSSSSEIDTAAEKHVMWLVDDEEVDEPDALDVTAPAPMPMPNVSAEEAEGKFPRRGDEDIVGPMVRVQSKSVQGAGTGDARKRWWRLWTGWKASRQGRR
ncbi:hypothetical protein P152DRAFT_106515 [Eremomyces bilateralis CBS 781.70]|uniref:Uncharacterized protein n=1 Tax=Eremomyces bilateralis CBS 781.70 TaxID=1392243 RepID=A0A6G1FWR0_9PEZI|nr:uncharacterized protein P152DRAFT_106515 [Eremomyces bilateralis CBS 781.70]KAF1810277.1 hypothetical protein P152DRAFT_106515 [Eremomyces bilateralis CBS 781.70]